MFPKFIGFSIISKLYSNTFISENKLGYFYYYQMKNQLTVKAFDVCMVLTNT